MIYYHIKLLYKKTNREMLRGAGGKGGGYGIGEGEGRGIKVGEGGRG
jgi:hypothetical protein